VRQETSGGITFVTHLYLGWWRDNFASKLRFSGVGRMHEEGQYVVQGRKAQTEVVCRLVFVLGEGWSLIQNGYSDSSVWHKIWEKSLFRLCGLVAIVPGYRSRDPGPIPGAVRISEQ
jgi:hypothetical protein